MSKIEKKKNRKTLLMNQKIIIFALNKTYVLVNSFRLFKESFLNRFEAYLGFLFHQRF